jgi:predicted secreted acid phosphatase
LLDFVNYLWRNGTQGFFLKNKARSNAVTTNSDTKRNIPRGLSFAITFCTALIPLTNVMNRADSGYQVHGTERKISHLLYMDDLKLLGKNENDLKKEINIVQTISKDIILNFVLEK